MRRFLRRWFTIQGWRLRSRLARFTIPPLNATTVWE
jgi:hypothetical protein